MKTKETVKRVVKSTGSHSKVAEEKNKVDWTVMEPAQDTPKLDYKVQADEQVPLTVAKAKEIIALNTFAGERMVNRRHLQNLYNAQCSGRFMWDQVTIALCECEGKTYRLNGQHTCWLRVNMNSAPDPTVRLLTYKVKTEADMRSLYCTFDQNKARSFTHNLRASLMGTTATKDVWPSKVGELASAFRMFHCDTEYKAGTVTVADIVDMITNEHNQLFLHVARYFMSRYDRYHRIRVKAVVASMFAMFEASPRKAHEFWDPVVEQLGFTGKDDPRLQLRRWLDTHGHGRTHHFKQATEEDMYRVCIVAWNRWRKGEPVLGLRASDKRLKAA